MDKIEEQNRRILETQEEISKILKEADAPPPPVKVDVSNSPVLGMDQAPITIVEFTDYQCPYCSKFHTDTFPKLHDEYMTNGTVRLVHKDFPLPMHKDAMHAAQVGRCAEDQRHFWEMRDYMQLNPEKLEAALLRTKAVDLDLDMTEFDNCLAADKYKASIEKEIQEGQKLGVNGTPAFVIGKSGDIVTGDLITGALPLEAFEAKINSLLK